MAPARAGTATAPVGLLVRVVAKETIAEGVCGLTLADSGGRRLPDWTPGAHIDLILPSGLVRQYSLCGDRWDPDVYRIAVLREQASRGGSAYVHDHVEVGDTLGVGGPRNNFMLAPADSYLFIAGGIGITPLLPMIDQAIRMGTPWTLLYGGRSRASMAYLDDLRAHEECLVLRPQDEYGLLDVRGAVSGVPAGTKVYCCGPAPLLAAAEEACADMPRGALRIERFVARDQRRPARTRPYRVEMARSHKVVTVQPDECVLDALLDADVLLLASCRQGVCGTCETTVLQGAADHRDSILDDDERERSEVFYPCVSRSLSDALVIDL